MLVLEQRHALLSIRGDMPAHVALLFPLALSETYSSVSGPFEACVGDTCSFKKRR